MADKSISELVAATQVTPNDLFVLEQSSTAKKLTGQILENWLVSFADGHGGIQDIEYTAPVLPSLEGTLTITLADETEYDVTVTNGMGISSISKTGSSGLVDNYKILYNNGTYTTFSVTNGEKGDPGDNAYCWIRWAGVTPTSDDDITDVPDKYIGIYTGIVDDPDDLHYTDFSWFLYKGEKGETGENSTIEASVTYQAHSSGTIAPTGSWTSSIPALTTAKPFLWSRTKFLINAETETEQIVYAYSVSSKGEDGEGVGDMTKAEYDADGDGKVDAANDSDALEGHPAGYFIADPETKALNQVLTYNGSAWVAQSPSSAVSSVNGRTGAVVLNSGDVGAIANPSSKTSGQVLTYNGSSWVAAASTGGTKYKKLWENGSPSSSFAEQDVVVQNLVSYSAIVVVFRVGTSALNTSLMLCLEKGVGMNMNINRANQTFANGAVNHRSFTIAENDNKIHFLDAYSSGNNPNQYVIPYKVFGIEGAIVQ